MPPLPPPLPHFMRPIPVQPIIPPRKRRLLWLAITGAAIVVVGSLSLVAVHIHNANALPARESVSTDQKHRDTKDAFASTVPVGDQETRDISAALDRVNAAIQKRNLTMMAAAFDSDRLCDELDRIGVFDSISQEEKKGAIAGIKSALPSTFANTPTLGWKRHQVKRIVMSSNHREAIVYDLEFDGAGDAEYSVKVRWWVRKSGSQWRAWDMEPLESGMRISTLMSSSMAAALNGGAVSGVSTSGPQLQAVMAAIQQGDLKKAEAGLKQLDGITFPREMSAVREYLWAAVRIRQGEDAEGLKNCDAIEATGLDFPGIHQLRAVAYNRMGRYEDAVKSARASDEALGPDRDVLYEMGTALAHLKRLPEAAEAFEKSLDEDPDASGALAELSHVLPPGNKPELAVRLAHAKNPNRVFGFTAGLLIESHDYDGLQSLTDGYRNQKASSADPLLAYYDAELKIFHKQYKDAEVQLKLLLPYAKAKSQSAYVSEYISAAHLAGDSMEAYANAPDPVSTFRTLAPLLLRENDSVLDRLIAAHIEKNPNDPWVYFYQAKRYTAAKRDEEADAAYNKGTSLAADTDKDTFRYARVRARFNSGKGMLAYQQMEQPELVFVQLARLYTYAKQADGLAILVAARKHDDPSDLNIPIWEAQANFLAADYNSAVSVLDRCRPTDSDDRNRFMWSDLYVRSQVRLHHFDEARAEANRPPEAERDPWKAAIIECAAGKVRDATRAMDALLARDDDVGLDDLYADPDIGPALATPAFADWRRKHPRPTTEPADD